MSEASKVPLSEQQLAELDRLVARGKPISTEELTGGKRGPGVPGPDCWLDTAIDVAEQAIHVTEIAECAEAGFTPELDVKTGERFYTLDQLKDLRRRATKS